MMCVYTIYNNYTDKYYIGSTSNFSRRRTDHFTSLRNNRHSNSNLQKDFNKYGEAHFSIFPIKELSSPEELKYFEELFISHYDSLGKCYNLYKHCYAFTDDVRLTISKKVSGELNGNFSRPHTEEEKKRIRDNRYGKDYICKPKTSSYTRKSEQEILESRKRVSEFMRNRVVSQETRDKLSSYRKGRHHSSDTLAKLRRQRKGEGNSNCKLSKEEVFEIYCKMQSGVSPKSICEEYSIGMTLAYKIRRKEHWAFNG